MPPTRKKFRRIEYPKEADCIIKVNDISSIMLSQKSILLSDLPSWLLKSNGHKCQTEQPDNEFSIETSFLHKSGTSEPINESLDFGLKILQTFSLASEAIENEKENAEAVTRNHDTQQDNNGNVEENLQIETVHGEDTDFSVFCSKELDILLESENNELQCSVHVPNQAPTDIKYEIPNKQSGYVKTLQDALNKTDVTIKCPHESPNEQFKDSKIEVRQKRKRKKRKWSSEKQCHQLRSSDAPVFKKIKVNLLKSMNDLYTRSSPKQHTSTEVMLTVISASLVEHALSTLHMLNQNNILVPFSRLKKEQDKKLAARRVKMDPKWKAVFFAKRNDVNSCFSHVFANKVLQYYKDFRQWRVLSTFAERNLYDMPVVLSKTETKGRWKIKLVRHKLRWKSLNMRKGVVILPSTMSMKKCHVPHLAKMNEREFSAARVRVFGQESKHNFKSKNVTKRWFKSQRNSPGYRKLIKMLQKRWHSNNRKPKLECKCEKEKDNACKDNSNSHITSKDSTSSNIVSKDNTNSLICSNHNANSPIASKGNTNSLIASKDTTNSLIASNDSANMNKSGTPSISPTKGVMYLKFNANKSGSCSMPFYIKVLSECDWSNHKNRILSAITQAHVDLKKTTSGKYTCIVVEDFCVEALLTCVANVMRSKVRLSLWKTQLSYNQPVTLIRISWRPSAKEIKNKFVKCATSIARMLQLNADMSGDNNEECIAEVFDISKNDNSHKTQKNSSPNDANVSQSVTSMKSQAFKLGTLGCLNSKLMKNSTQSITAASHMPPGNESLSHILYMDRQRALTVVRDDCPPVMLQNNLVPIASVKTAAPSNNTAAIAVKPVPVNFKNPIFPTKVLPIFPVIPPQCGNDLTPKNISFIPSVREIAPRCQAVSSTAPKNVQTQANAHVSHLQPTRKRSYPNPPPTKVGQPIQFSNSASIFPVLHHHQISPTHLSMSPVSSWNSQVVIPCTLPATTPNMQMSQLDVARNHLSQSLFKVCNAPLIRICNTPPTKVLRQLKPAAQPVAVQQLPKPFSVVKVPSIPNTLSPSTNDTRLTFVAKSETSGMANASCAAGPVKIVDLEMKNTGKNDGQKKLLQTPNKELKKCLDQLGSLTNKDSNNKTTINADSMGKKSTALPDVPCKLTMNECGGKTSVGCNNQTTDLVFKEVLDDKLDAERKAKQCVEGINASCLSVKDIKSAPQKLQVKGSTRIEVQIPRKQLMKYVSNSNCSSKIDSKTSPSHVEGNVCNKADTKNASISGFKIVRLDSQKPQLRQQQQLRNTNLTSDSVGCKTSVETNLSKPSSHRTPYDGLTTIENKNSQLLPSSQQHLEAIGKSGECTRGAGHVPVDNKKSAIEEPNASTFLMRICDQKGLKDFSQKPWRQKPRHDELLAVLSRAENETSEVNCD